MSGGLAVDIIATAIDDHDYSITNIGRCVCGVKTDDMPAHRSERVVSVLAASGHAIVQVPKGTVREYGGLSWGADEDGEYPTVTATPGYDTVRLYVEDARHTREGAVEIAGFLLAAAAAAEEEKA